jgi:hypothetical protein
MLLRFHINPMPLYTLACCDSYVLIMLIAAFGACYMVGVDGCPTYRAPQKPRGREVLKSRQPYIGKQRADVDLQDATEASLALCK